MRYDHEAQRHVPNDPHTVIVPGSLDIDAALAGLAKAVEKNGPDYVDPSADEETISECVYNVRDDEGVPVAPSCIAGHVLWDHGIRFGEGDEGSTFEGSLLRGLADGGFEITPGAKAVLSMAQNKQDLGKTWGDALQAATEVAAALRTVDIDKEN